MEILASYLFWTSIYLAIAGIFQWTVVSKIASPVQNRWFILIGFASSLFMGLLILLPPQDIVLAGSSSAYLLPEVVIGASSGLEHTQHGIYEAFSTRQVLSYASLGISLVLLLRLLGSILFLLARIRFNERMVQHGCTILPVKNQSAPCSFFGFVFIPAHMLSDSNLYTILLHEKAHALKWHSLDLIFVEMLTILFWFHPAIWYLRHELKMQHEYDADRFVLHAFHDKKAYQRLLLNVSFNAYSFPVTNPFNYSPLKKRIMMMNKKFQKNRLRVVLSMLMVMPLFSMVWLLQSYGQSPETAFDPVEAEISDKGTAVADTYTAVTDAYDEDVIFTVVEEQPEFPGGEDARMEFMQDNLKYPEKAKEAGVQGTVFVSFVVEKDGSISNVQILRGLSPEVDAEAVRVVEAMPDWTPGRQRGEEVRVQFNMPIRFHLGVDEDTQKPEPDKAMNLIIIEGEQYTIADRFDITELNELIPVEEIGHIEMLTGKDAEPYGYKRVIKISRKEELEFFRGE